MISYRQLELEIYNSTQLYIVFVLFWGGVGGGVLFIIGGGSWEGLVLYIAVLTINKLNPDSFANWFLKISEYCL